MRSRSPAFIAVAAALVVLGIVGVTKVGPWARGAVRLTSSVPGPDPLAVIDPIPLRAGSTACVADVGLDTDTAYAQFIAVAERRAGPPLRVSVIAPGYRASSVVPGGYTGHAVLTAPVRPSPPASAIGRVCIANAGRHSVTLEGSGEFRTDTRQTTTVDGRAASGLTLKLYQRDVRSWVRQTPTMFRRAALYKVGFLRGWMLFPFALLVVLGVPLALLWALWSALRDEPAMAAR